MISYVVINKPAASVYAGPARIRKDENGYPLGTVSDEGLYGNACRVLEENGDTLYILSSYGYAGYIDRKDVLPVTGPELTKWLSGAMVVDGTCVDILTAPVVQGSVLMTLPRGALVKPVEPSKQGYTKVLLADKTAGYIASNCLMEKRFGEELLTEDPSVLTALQAGAASNKETAAGGKTGFCFQSILDRWYANPASPDGSVSLQEKEEAFRKELAAAAMKYLGVQYRWGGRSSFGLDCSGLTHMSYLLCGVHIFRDAVIAQEYPLKRLELEWENRRFALSNLDSGALKTGDTLYFPGHVAMYLGDGLYIHSTGKATDMGVVINSLRPEHPLFREDLPEKLYAAAGLRL